MFRILVSMIAFVAAIAAVAPDANAFHGRRGTFVNVGGFGGSPFVNVQTRGGLFGGRRVNVNVGGFGGSPFGFGGGFHHGFRSSPFVYGGGFGGGFYGGGFGGGYSPFIYQQPIFVQQAIPQFSFAPVCTTTCSFGSPFLASGGGFGGGFGGFGGCSPFGY